MESVRALEDVTYRVTPAGDLELDLYLPASGEERPAVAMVHGGGWEADHRGMFESHLRWLAGRGYVGVDLTHRLSTDATFPTPVADVKYAIRWLKDRAHEYGIDPGRIAVGGHSSGAHLAAVSPGHPGLEPDAFPDESSQVAAAVVLNGPYNLAKLGQLDPARLFISGFVRRLFGGGYLDRPCAYDLASCQTHVEGDELPY